MSLTTTTSHYTAVLVKSPTDLSPYWEFDITGPGWNAGYRYVANSDSCGPHLIKSLQAAYDAGLIAARRSNDSAAFLFEWMEDHVDDLTIVRDKSKGKSIQLSYCSNFSGCQCELDASTIAEAVRLAIKQDEDVVTEAAKKRKLR